MPTARIKIWTCCALLTTLSLLHSHANADDLGILQGEKKTPWSVVGRDCENWYPDVSNETADKSFTQKKTCKTSMTRKVRLIYKKNDGSTFTLESDPEHQVKIETETRTVKGQVDAVSSTKKQRNFGPWELKEIISCENTLSIAKNLPIGVVAHYPLICEAFLTREKIAFDFWLSGKKIKREDLTETENKKGTYIKIETIAGLMESWFNDGFRERSVTLLSRRCEISHLKQIQASWEWGIPVSFTIPCNEQWVRSIENLQKTSSGKRRVNSVENITFTKSSTEIVEIWGQNDYVIFEDYVYTDWVSADGEKKNCFHAPTMDPSLLAWGSTHVQTYQCKLKQERNRNRIRTYAAGYSETLSSEIQSREIEIVQTQYVYGGKDELLSTDPVISTPWKFSKDLGCEAWTPSETIIPQNFPYQQYQECIKILSRSLSKVEHWKSGPQKINLGDEFSEQKTVFVRGAVGVAIVSIDDVSWNLSAPPANTTLVINPSARMIRVVFDLEIEIEQSTMLNIGNHSLEIPPQKAGRNVYLYSVSEYGIQGSFESLPVMYSGSGIKGALKISVE